ncbi:MAG: cytochrome c oxidase subunit 3 [Myxococcales bacterium]|nr:cytochrome c oxidase subunit 3 [Myxococcales bacterium]MDD9965909.1 cytochrome c oxidase subunit 3 [Myxococcales bacterium]
MQLSYVSDGPDKVVDIRGRMPAARRRQVAPNGVIGTLLFVMAEVMLFAGFISAHAVAKTTALSGWPPPNQPRLPVEETAVNTAALLLSGAALAYAYRVYLRDVRRARVPFLIALLLGCFFVAFQGVEWLSLLREGLTVTSSTHGAFFYLIVGCHALHAVAALIVLALQYRQLLLDRLSPGAFAGAQVFWFFVVGMWPVLYWKVYF